MDQSQTAAPVPPTPPTPAPAARRGFLDWVERVGNALPEPAILFAMLAVVVVLASGVATWTQWKVTPVRVTFQTEAVLDASGQPVLDEKGQPQRRKVKDERGQYVKTTEPIGQPLEARSLMTAEGVYWMLSSMVRNFTMLPALGLVFVSMLGIGLAEKFGLFSALMRLLATVTPKRLLTPMVVFIGANSSVASDAGYVILPPLAAALYLAVGRSPVAGMAAAFAGVAGGFGGGFFPTAADGFLAAEGQRAAQILDPSYMFNTLGNYWFKAGSAVLVMLAGWLVTDYIVEPRQLRAGPLDGTDTSAVKDLAVTPAERRGLVWAGLVFVAVLGVFAAMVFVPGAPLQGVGQPTVPRGPTPHVLAEVPVRIDPAGTAPGVPAHDVIGADPLVVTEAPARARLIDPAGEKWSQIIVPLIFLAFLLPGMAYGAVVGTLRSQRDFIDGLYHGIRGIVPVLCIAFFLGQFAAYFTYTGLDRMIAYTGGAALVAADLPVPLLIAMFVVLVVLGDFLMSGMLSKFAVMAPIFIPMFMFAGMSPELTTAAYRIGDSVVNVVTPLNSYLLIILAVLSKYRKNAGLGSLVSIMLPYSLVFGVLWTLMLLCWYWSGLPLGMPGPLTATPPG